MPDLVLRVGSASLAYFVQVAVACLFCLLLAQLTGTPRRRFAVWFGFLLAAAGYWVFTIARAAAMATQPSRAAANALASAHIPALSYALWLPSSWSHAVDVVGYAAAAAYVCSALVLLGARVAKHVALHRTLRHAARPGPELALLFAQLRRALGVRQCELLVLEGLCSPATAFWRRPRIVLPDSCNSPHPHVADALWHELIHVSRRDYLWSVVADAVRCVLFFHPAVWIASRRMRIERELACDAAVIAGRPEHRADYAESLTRFARIRMLWGRELLGIDFAAAVSVLELRVRALLDEAPREPRWRLWFRGATVMAMAVVVVAIWPAVVIGLHIAPPAPRLAAAVVLHPEARPVHLLAAQHRGGRARLRTAPSWERVHFSEVFPVPGIDTPAATAWLMPPSRRIVLMARR